MKGTPTERVFALLKRPPGRYKFKHIVRQTRLTAQEVELAIVEVRKQHPNLTFAKFDKTFYLSDTPTQYNFQTDLSTVLPLEGCVGLITDTHLCSNAERLDLVNFAYDTFKARGIKHVFHSGDLVDGQDVYRGHNQNLKVFGDMAQAAYFIRRYPTRQGITTYAIAGNHDLATYLKTGNDVASLIVNGFEHQGRHVEGRKDIVYLGQYSHRIVFPQQVTMEMLHPIGNASYAKSYKQQKRSENMDRNSRPDLQVTGHFHDFNFTWAGGSYLLALPKLKSFNLGSINPAKSVKPQRGNAELAASES